MAQSRGPEMENSDARSSGPDPEYEIQTGAFKVQENARDRLNKLQALGYDARILTLTHPEEVTWYLVRTGTFFDRKTAEQAMAQFVKKNRHESLCQSLEPILSPVSDNWMTQFCNTLWQGSRKMGIALTEAQVSQMACHAAQLEKWNRHINLTAIKGPVDLARKHFLDAVAIQPFIHTRNGQWMDMGTGGGFPGLPLKLLNPEIRMILVDGSRKKFIFSNM